MTRTLFHADRRHFEKVFARHKGHWLIKQLASGKSPYRTYRYFANFMTIHWRRFQKRTGDSRHYLCSDSFRTADVVLKIVEQDGHCYWCENPLDVITIDHLLPLAEGGNNSVANIAVCCKRCNTKKGIKSPEVFRRMVNDGEV